MTKYNPIKGNCILCGHGITKYKNHAVHQYQNTQSRDCMEKGCACTEPTLKPEQMKTLQEDAIEQTKLKLTAIIRELQEAKALLEASECAGETPVTRSGREDAKDGLAGGSASLMTPSQQSGKVEDSSHIRTSTTDNSPASEKPEHVFEDMGAVCRDGHPVCKKCGYCEQLCKGSKPEKPRCAGCGKTECEHQPTYKPEKPELVYFDMMHCNKCNQMTNHRNGVCQKCEKATETEG